MIDDYINDGLPFLGTNCPPELEAYGGLRRCLSEGIVVRVMRNTFRDARSPDTRDLRLAALALHSPKDAIVADDSVAWAQGVDTSDPADRYSLKPSIIVPNGGSRPRHPGVRVREGTIPEADVVTMGGVRMLSNVRAASDMLRLKWRPNALSACDAMARGGLIEPREVEEYVRPLRRLPGVCQARELVRLIDPNTTQWGESLMKLRLADAGFPRPSVQFEIVDPRIGRRILDCAYPDWLIAIEYDGLANHTTDVDRAHDLKRRTELSELFGWRWVIARRDDLIGTDDHFEYAVGELLGQTPRPRQW